MNLKNNRTAAVGLSAAMLVTLGGVGGAFAADAIGSRDIKNDSIRQADVKDGGLGFRDFNGYTQDRIDRPGPKGEDGKDGKDGKDGVSGYEVRAKEAVLPAGGAPTTVTVDCGDKVALGGGYKVDNPEGVNVYHSMGSNLTKQADGTTWGSNGWEVRAVNKNTAKTNITAFVTCAKAS